MLQGEIIVYFAIGLVFAIAMVIVVYYMLYRFKKEADVRHFLMNTLMFNHRFMQNIITQIEKDVHDKKYDFPPEMLTRMKEHQESMEENLPKIIVD